jgi:hypothetical protein
LERFLRWISPLGLNEVAYVIAPFWFAGLFISIIYHALWLRVVIDVGLVYILSAAVVSTMADRWSKRSLGLKRYIVVPIPRWLAVALVRGRMNLPKEKRYFLLHVRVNRVQDPRRMEREMRSDIRRGMQAEWTNNAVFLGNTFGSLGRLQEKLLQEWGDVEIIEGTFFPLQTLFLKPERYQRKMFGRVLSKDTKWKIVKFEVREKEEDSK